MVNLFMITEPIYYQWRDLFPYTIRGYQAQFIASIQYAVNQKIIGILEGRNGFGKTICNLVATLPFGKRIIYATRTHQECENVCFELEKINSKGYNFKAVTLASRKRLCINPYLVNDMTIWKEPILAVKFCEQYFKGRDGLCTFNDLSGKKVTINTLVNLSDKPAIDKVLSIDKLRAYGTAHNICPFYLSQRLAETADVVVVPFNYLIDPSMRLKRFIAENNIYIIDEAHSVPSFCKSIASKKITQYTTDLALNEAKNSHQSNNELITMIEKIASFLNRIPTPKMEQFSNNSTYLFGDVFMELLKLEGFNQEWIDRFISFNYMAESIQLEMIKSKVQKCHILDLIDFFRAVKDSAPTSTIYIWDVRRHKTGTYKSLEMYCLDASIVFQQLVKSGNQIILTSGTLAPQNNFQIELGIKRAYLNNFLSSDNDSAKLFILGKYQGTRLSTSFNDRSNIDIIRKYGEVLDRLLKVLPKTGAALVFFPSKQVMASFIDVWKTSGTYQSIARMCELYMEVQDPNFEDQIIPKFKAASEVKKTVMFAVARGIVSEGFNAPKIIKAIFILGIPLPNWADSYIQAQIKYYDKIKNGLGMNWYISDGMKWTNQECGRGIRLIDDYCVFFLIDERFTNKLYYNKLSPSLKNYVVPPINDMDIYMCEEMTREFFESKQ